MRKAIAPSLEVAGNILTGTSTSERRRLPDQTGMGAMRDTRGRYGLPRIWSNRRPPQVNKDGPRKGTSLIPVLNARMPPLHPSGMAFCERRLPMAKLILLVALAFSITTMMVLNPQPAMACPGNNGR